MLGLGHILLHVGLCHSVARATPQTEIAMHVKASYRIGEPPLDKTFHFTRGEDPETAVEFDLPRGVYALRLDVPKYNCSATDFIDVLADRNRSLTENLDDGPPAPRAPVVLLEGEAPLSFQYVHPTFVLFDGSLACNAPVTQPLPSKVTVEEDRDAYYAWLNYDESQATTSGETPAPLGSPDPHQPVVALRLRTATGLFHYVRIRIRFPPWRGWPDNVQFNVTEDEVDGLATEKADTLLCPKIWETRVYG